MTRKEAIKWLECINTRKFGWDEYAMQESQTEIRERCEQCVREALDMAIEALQAEGGDAEMNEVKSPYMQHSPNGATHGRLIDAYALMRRWNDYLEMAVGNFPITPADITQIIKDAPTAPVVDITQRDLCQDISCTDCPFMQETCKLMDYVAYADRPHGEWIEKNSHTYICDQCGFEQAIYGNLHEYNFCPKCGADMRGDSNDKV